MKSTGLSTVPIGFAFATESGFLVVPQAACLRSGTNAPACPTHLSGACRAYSGVTLAAQEFQFVETSNPWVNMQRALPLFVILVSHLFFVAGALGHETDIVAEASSPTVVSQKNPSNRDHPQNVGSTGSHGAGLVNAGGGVSEIRIPSLVETLPELGLFLDELHAGVQAGTFGSTEELIERCRQFYIAERMSKIKTVIPGWGHMSSFADGKTLWHLKVAMVALLGLEEYRSMSPDQQTVLQWVVLLHDMAKEPVEGRDHRHAFRSAALVGRIIPQLGFPVTAAYQSDFPDWFELESGARPGPERAPGT